MQADLLGEALGKKVLGHPLPDTSLQANPDRLNAARWPQSRFNGEVHPLRWLTVPLGSARLAIAMAQSYGRRMIRFPIF